MATDFIMPRVPGEQQSPYYGVAAQQQRQPYRPRQQALFQPTPIPTGYTGYPTSAQLNSPISPLSAPGSISPTTSKSYTFPQNRPLYVPAVLRPTEFPSKEPPLRPKDEEENDAPDEGSRPSSGFMSLGPFGRLSRRSTSETAKSVDSGWDLDQFPKPTGPPTRKHWKPDHESSMCDHATCKRTFSYFTRRHHCRKCGNIFCDQHSALEVPLDQDANFNPRGALGRSCDHCYTQFREWRNLATGRTPARNTPSGARQQHQQQQQHRDIPSSPVTAVPAVTGPDGRPLASSEAAHSVPRDWNWSTF